MLWVIVHTQQFDNRSDAIKHENYLKSGKGRERLGKNPLTPKLVFTINKLQSTKLSGRASGLAYKNPDLADDDAPIRRS